MLRQTFSSETLDSKGEADTYPWRLVYADHVPVHEWTVWYGTTQEQVNERALYQSKRDLRPGSGVFDNVFVIQRWTGEEWDDYAKDGEDLTDVCFGRD